MWSQVVKRQREEDQSSRLALEKLARPHVKNKPKTKGLGVWLKVLAYQEGGLSLITSTPKKAIIYRFQSCSQTYK
jgi:hypothetical protein